MRRNIVDDYVTILARSGVGILISQECFVSLGWGGYGKIVLFREHSVFPKGNLEKFL